MNTTASIFQRIINESRRGNQQQAEALFADLETKFRLAQNSNNTGTELELLELIRAQYKIVTKPLGSSCNLVPQQIKPKLPGVSLVTCCMNRTENLLKAIPSWLAHDRISQIVIVDWSSDKPIHLALEGEGISDPRICIVRAINEPRWILSYAFNLGFRCAEHEKILKVDADITLSEDFFQLNVLEDGQFIAGQWESADQGQEHINGFFFTQAVYLNAISGFNEYITTYGWDDDDIYSRLMEFGVKRACVDTSTIYHLPHDDEQRLGAKSQEPNCALDQLKSDTLFNIRLNRIIAYITPRWNFDRELAPFQILQEHGCYSEVERLQDRMPHVVSNSLRQDIEVLAAMEVISWRFGAHVYHMEKAEFSQLLRSKRLDDICHSDFLGAPLGTSAINGGRPAAPMVKSIKKKVFVDAQHGLGNRLRAIASGAAIAKSTDRELVIVWEADHHCECVFSDLFDYQGPVIDEAFVKAAPALGIDTYNYMESEENSQKNRPIMIGERDIYIRSAFVAESEHTNWDDENEFLRSLVPASSVTDLVAPFQIDNHVAAHIRMEGGAGLDVHAYEQASNWTDKDHDLLQFWREKSNYRHFISHIDKLFEIDPTAKLFLATDMQETYDVFSGYYGEKVEYLSRDVYDRSKEQIIYGLADVILLSRCNRLLGSTWSSFSEMAIRLTDGFQSIEMSGEDF